MTLDDLKSNKPESFVDTITPTFAERILRDRMPENRPLRKGVAEAYGEDMKAGRWRVTDQGIGFNKQGNLIDGQHRLYGCIDADASFRTLVVIGLDESARDVIDTGLRRTDADVLGLRLGMKVEAAIVGAARMLASPRDRSKLARQPFLDFVQLHTPALSFAAKLAPPARGITIAPVIAVVARASYHEDAGELGRFMRILASGMPEGQNWSPVLLLRNWLIESKASSRGQVVRVEAYYKTVTALKAFLAGSDLTKLYAAKDDHWMLGAAKAKAVRA